MRLMKTGLATLNPRVTSLAGRTGEVGLFTQSPIPGQRSQQFLEQGAKRHHGDDQADQKDDIDHQAGTAAGIVAPRRTDRQNTTDSTKDTP